MTPDVAQAIGRSLDYAAKIISSRRFYAARAHLNEHTKRYGGGPRVDLLMGLTFHKDKQYGTAKPYFIRATRTDPRLAPAFYFLGYCCYYLGELDQARAAFERHIELDPDEGDSHFGIGIVDLEEDKLDEARKRFEKAIELTSRSLERDPSQRHLMGDIAKNHARLGDVLIRQDRFSEARDELVMCTTQWPNHYEAWHKLSTVLTRLGDEEGAAKAMKEFEAARQRVRPIAPPAPPNAPGAPSAPAPPTPPAAPGAPGPSPQAEPAAEPKHPAVQPSGPDPSDRPDPSHF